MTDTPLIVAVGQALYGSRWQSELARALGVAIRTVQRWSSGNTEPQPGVYRDLLALVRERAHALGPLEPMLERAARQTMAP